MPTVDTNIVLRWLLDDVPEQTAVAERILNGDTRCVVPDVVLIEAVYVLERSMLLSRTTVAQSIEAILGLANLEIHRICWRAALDDYLAHPKVSITDVFLAAQARDSSALPLYTFDRKLASQIAGAELAG